ncbi:M48 metallopeptidase family protein [Vibrio sp. RC27]
MDVIKRYLKGYPTHIIEQVEGLVARGKFIAWFDQRYPKVHHIQSEKALYAYTMAIKERYLKKSQSINKVVFDSKIHVINNALGLHTYANKIHGGKIKRRNEIRISTLFKDGPEELLNMIVVHELAHIKEKEHNKAFYQLCCHMLPNYFQLELDARLYIIYRELNV